MAQFVQVPIDRVPEDSLHSLLEEYTSRDGTDYGERETTLQERVTQLRHALRRGDIALVYDTDSESWDFLERDAVRLLMTDDVDD